MRQRSALLVSDFNLETFARYLAHDEDAPRVSCTAAPFGQVMATLIQPPAPDSRPDLAVVWTSPEHVSPTFARCADGGEGDVEAVVAEVDQFCDGLRTFAAASTLVVVPTWVPVRERPGSVLLAMRADHGSSRLLLEMNLRLARNLAQTPNVYVVDAGRWMQGGDGRAALDPKLWYLAKVPFASHVFLAAVRDIKSALRGLGGEARKVVLLDLDDTLWGGLVGDVGWEKLRLGGHDAIGEAYVDFQRALQALTRRGVILGIVSKNEADVALEAIDCHPEMVLRRDAFAGWRINREDKARNVVELLDELNLGLASAVFIDDSPVERARVREALPEVLVPDWPADPMRFAEALARLRCFDVPAVTREDAVRTQMYVSERTRSELLSRIGSIDAWLKSLDIHVHVEPVADGAYDRVLQLLNKTNQLNLRTRRLTEAQFRAWQAGDGRQSWCFRVSDRLGDSGITGLLSLEHVGDAAEVCDFVLSCRVMGRKVEETMLHVAVEYARAAGLRDVRARFEPTRKNAPCLEFLKRSGLTVVDDGHVFVWSTGEPYPLPEPIRCTR